MSKRPTCDTPGCGKPIPKGGEGHPEICPMCLACLQMHGDRATKMLPGSGVPQPEMTVEWQVIPGDTQSVHVFTSEGAVFGFLASEWKRFVLCWDARKSCRLSVDVRRVEREKVVTPARLDKKKSAK